MTDEEKPTSSGKHKKEESSKEAVEAERSSDDEALDSPQSIQMFRALFQKLSITKCSEEDGPVKKVIDELTIGGLTKHWKEKGFKNIITMVGAGISTSAGIPDFRSPGSGLYDNLQKYKLPHPTAVFEMDYFLENPQPFFALAKELYPGLFNPTPSHYFVRLLHEKGVLLRHYTQNIDTLERIAGIPEQKLVEAHGTFYTGHCLTCNNLYTMEWMKEQIFSDSVPTCTMCCGVVKPDIIFFGENLPEKFYTLPAIDFEKCDLLIIMGTSLEVQPFASLTDRVGPQCIRLLINRTKVGSEMGLVGSWFGSSGLMFDSIYNTRDIAFIGDCDDGVWKLVEGLGWTQDLKRLIASEKTRLTGGGGEDRQSDPIDTQPDAKDKQSHASVSRKGTEDKSAGLAEPGVENTQSSAMGKKLSAKNNQSAWSGRQLNVKNNRKTSPTSNKKSQQKKAAPVAGTTKQRKS